MLSATGSISTAVAVLEIHILMNAVIAITAPTNTAGECPVTRSSRHANSVCSSHFSMAIESKKPPRKRKISGSA